MCPLLRAQGHKRQDGGNGIGTIHPDLFGKIVPVVHDEGFDASIDAIVEGVANIVHISDGVHARKIPLQRQITIVQRRGILADCEMAEQSIEFARPGYIEIKVSV